jgi:hypothetical protein
MYDEERGRNIMYQANPTSGKKVVSAPTNAQQLQHFAHNMVTHSQVTHDHVPADTGVTHELWVATQMLIGYLASVICKPTEVPTCPPAGCVMQVEQDGRWWCEGDGCYVDTPEHRYMMTIRLADLTGEAYVTVFNEQVRKENNSDK